MLISNGHVLRVAAHKGQAPLDLRAWEQTEGSDPRSSSCWHPVKHPQGGGKTLLHLVAAHTPTSTHKRGVNTYPLGVIQRPACQRLARASAGSRAELGHTEWSTRME